MFGLGFPAQPTGMALVDLSGFVLLSGAALIAAGSDLRYLQIPNRLILVVCLLYPIHVLSADAPVDVLGAVSMSGGILMIGFILFGLRLVGGGDVKFLAAAGLWAGTDLGFELVVLMALFGGVLALILLIPRGKRLLARIRAPSLAAVPAQAMPYGVAIAGALLVVIGQRIGE